MGALGDKEIKQIVRNIYGSRAVNFTLKREVSKSALRGIKKEFKILEGQIEKDIKAGKIKRVEFAGTTRIVPTSPKKFF